MLISPTIQYNSFQRVHFLRMLSKSLINMTDFYGTLDIAKKFSKNRTHFNNRRFLIMCYKNTENAPNLDHNRIPRQNTHSHKILKLQSPNYYYDSMNINVTIKATISNHRNETAIIFKQICDAVITSYPTKIFSIGTLFAKVIKLIDQLDRHLRYPSHCSKVFQESNALQHRAGLKGRGARGNFYWRSPITYFLKSSFVKGMYSLICKVLVCFIRYSRMCLLKCT